MARILVVDDSPELSEFFSILLKLRKFEVESAASKIEVEEKIISFSPELILLDVKLAGEDGREICRSIKSNSHSRHILVILLSADPRLLENYKECEAVDVIEKPFKVTTIIDKINQHL